MIIFLKIIWINISCNNKFLRETQYKRLDNHISKASGHLVFRFFLSKKFTRNHQDGKRLRYIKLHSDLTFPEQHLSCMCLFNLTFFSWTFVFLSFKILHVIIVHWVCLIKSLYWLHRTYYYYDYHYYMSLYSQHIF